MKNLLKKILILPQLFLVSLFFFIEKILKFILGETISLNAREFFINRIENETRIVKASPFKKIPSFSLYTPNLLCLYRKVSFYTKEPEMLEWIEEYGNEDAVFFDIGANVGIYSIYYSLHTKGRTYSFEPSVFNLKQLAKNVSINSLSEKITIIPNPLSDNTGISNFRVSDLTEGGALNAFGVDYDYENNKFESLVEYSILGMSLDNMIDKGLIKELPSLIKIDVDGIEHLILSGATKTLSNEKCKSVYVEVNDDFKVQSKQVEKILTNCGFNLKEKRHSIEFDDTNIYNQIWIK